MVRAALLLAGLVALGVAGRALAPGLLAHAEPTLRGAATLVAAGAALSAAGVPRQLVAFAGGYAFGLWRGGALALLAQMLGCAADFWFARLAGRFWATRRVAGRRSAGLNRLLAARPFATALTLRLLPVGNNLLLNLLAGASAIPARPFLAATLIGYVPQTAVFALAGSGVQVDRTVQLGLAAALFALSAALGLALLRAGGLAVLRDGGGMPAGPAEAPRHTPPEPPPSTR